MYVIREDMKILGTLREPLEQYEKKFGEQFIAFNYADFPGTKEKIAGQIYKETLERALQDDKPYHIVSHRYDEIDH